MIALVGSAWIAVSAPSSGVIAELVDRGGTVVGTIDVTDGAGSGAVAFAPFTGPERVRVLDVEGEVVGEAPAFPEIEE